MAMKYLKVWHDWPETTQYLTAAQKGTLIDALVKYARGDADAASPLKGAALALFPGFKRQIDQDKAAYDEISEKRRIAGSSGGKQKVANASKCKQKVAKGSKTYQDKDQDKDQDHDKDQDQEEDYGSFEKKIDIDPVVLRSTGARAQAISEIEQRYLDGCLDRSIAAASERLALPNDNWLTSDRARKATAQHVVDAIVRDARWAKEPSQVEDLYGVVLGVLEDRELSPLTIYMMAVQSAIRQNFYSRMHGTM